MGIAPWQSSVLVPPEGEHRHEYYHRSKVELVSNAVMADYALLRMVTPPPPHFNLYHAGWHPRSSGIPLFLNTPCGNWHSYVLPNHPKGDIKKINGTAALQNLSNPLYAACNIGATVLNFLFSWTGNSSSALAICSYLDYPWYSVQWCDHGVDHGSSGAPLFNANNQFIGPLSGLGNPCIGAVPTGVGKFKNVYPYSAIKNTLNPSHHWSTDQSGIGGRRISCYTDLDLPGGGLTQAYYFPANHYQSENRIVLRAQQRINVVAPITILNGAHYEFRAGLAVELNGLVNVHSGATFVAAIEGCTKSMNNSGSAYFEPQFVRLPKKLDLHEAKGAEQAIEVAPAEFLDLFPNPSNGNVRIHTDLQGSLNLHLLGISGNLVMSRTIMDGTMDVSGLASGSYVLRISDQDGAQRTARMVVSD